MHLASTKNIKITQTFFNLGIRTWKQTPYMLPSLKNIKKNTMAEIEDPRDWITTIKSIHKKEKLNVVAMQSSDFKSV